MEQPERRLYILDYLTKECPNGMDMEIPWDEERQRNMIRDLLLMRRPMAADKDFKKVLNTYLRKRSKERGLTDADDLEPFSPDDPETFLWQGDITTIRCGAIVNSTNELLYGELAPSYDSISGSVFTYGGTDLRYDCFVTHREQGFDEPPGDGKITFGFCLPAAYVIHTVPPMLDEDTAEADVPEEAKELLKSCYHTAIYLADTHQTRSVVFPCIGTGAGHFPKELAARIAVETVRKYKEENECHLKVIFDVYTDEDRAVYEKVLSE